MSRLLSVVFSIFLGVVSLAQEPPSSGFTFRGTIQDQTGAAVPGAKVTLTNKKSEVEIKTKPDEGGSFRFEGVPPGSYELKVKAENFATTEINVKIADFDPEPVRVRMAVKSKSEEVTVTADSGLDGGIALDPGDNANAVKIEEELLFALPMEGQNVVGALANFLSPAAQGAMGPSIVVDGVEGAFDVPAWSIKRIRMNKNPYSVQFRRPGKSRIEVTTRDGRSNFHGGLSIIAGNSALDARNALARTKPDANKRLLEGRLTGPILSLPLWYFFSAERLEDRQSAIVNARTLNGPFIENFRTPLSRTNLLGRLDIRPNRLHSMNLRYALIDMIESNRGVGGFDLPEQAYSGRERESSVTFSDRRISTANFSNDFRFQFTREEERLGASANTPAVVVQGAFKAGPSQNFRRDQATSLKFQDEVNYYVGRHRLQFGGQLRPRFTTARQQSNFAGTYEFANLDQFAAGLPFVFRINGGVPDVSFTDHSAYEFVQDQIQLHPNLHVLAGLRHEWHANIPGGHRLAPRLALAYSPGRKSTVIRVGAGLFYEDFPRSIMRQRLLLDGVRLRETVIPNPSFPSPPLSDTFLTPQSVVRVAQGLTLPYLFQGSFGVEQSFHKRIQATAEYRFLRGVHLYRSRNINAPIAGALLRPDPDFLNINQVESTGSMRSHAVEVGLRWNLKRFTGMAQYTVSRTSDDAYGVFALPANSYDLRPEWGRADYDRRHHFSLIGGSDLPGKWRTSAILTLGSGLPFNVTTGRDDNGDTVSTDRPVGTTRNTGLGSGLARIDIRLTKTFDVFRLYKKAKKDTNNLELSLDLFNAFNHTNYDRFVGVLTSPFFGTANSALSARTMQASLRYSF